MRTSSTSCIGRVITGIGMLAVIAGASATTMAGEIAPHHAHSANLGGVSVVTYYTTEVNGYRVVVTAAPGSDAVPIRFAATLLPGQRSVVTVPRGADEAPLALEIARLGDRVVVEKAEHGLVN